MRSLLAALTIALAGVAPAQEPSPAAPESAIALELPPGALRDAVAKLSRATEPADLGPELGAPNKAPGIAREPGTAGEIVRRVETWERWHAALAAVRAKEDPRARARLALLALEQGRYESAWRHLEAASAAPDVLAALLPRFVPGVEAGAPLERGGRAAKLADGARLAPALPPPVAADVEADPLRSPRTMRAEVDVGAARVALTIALESEGVQIDVAHVSGGAAKLSIVLPRSEEHDISAEYVDWYKQDTLGAPLALEVQPGDEPHVLFARFEPRAPLWPTRTPEELPASVRSGGLWLVSDPADPEHAFHVALARALDFPELGLSCRVRAPGEAKPGGVDVDLTRAEGRERKRAWLIERVEDFVTRR